MAFVQIPRQKDFYSQLGSTVQDIGNTYLEAKARQEALDYERSIKERELALKKNTAGHGDSMADKVELQRLQGKMDRGEEFDELDANNYNFLGKKYAASFTSAQPRQGGVIAPHNSGTMESVKTVVEPKLSGVNSLTSPVQSSPKIGKGYISPKYLEAEKKRKEDEEIKTYTLKKLREEEADRAKHPKQRKKYLEDVAKTDFELEKSDVKRTINDLASKTTGKEIIKTTLDAYINKLSNSNLTKDEKIVIGRQALKTLNSPEGADAIGAEEAKRLGGLLEFKMFNVTEPGPLIGRDVDGFIKQLKDTSDILAESANANRSRIEKLKADFLGKKSVATEQQNNIITTKTGESYQLNPQTGKYIKVK